MQKKIINTTQAPAPIGPYNQAVQAGNLLFVSGQIPLNPTTNELITNGIQAETQQVLQNLQAILHAANLTFEHVVKTTIFLRTMDDFATVNQLYAQYFDPNTAPARETVAVAGLPRNVNIEISVIALIP